MSFVDNFLLFCMEVAVKLQNKASTTTLAEIGKEVGLLVTVSVSRSE